MTNEKDHPSSDLTTTQLHQLTRLGCMIACLESVKHHVKNEENPMSKEQFKRCGELYSQLLEFQDWCVWNGMSSADFPHNKQPHHKDGKNT